MRYRKGRPAIRVSDKSMVIHRDKLKCIQCGKDLVLSSPTSLSNGAFHHIVPLVYGGENNHFNLCSLCVSCHNKSHSGRESKEKYLDMYSKYITNRFLWERENVPSA